MTCNCRNGRFQEQDSADFTTDYKQLHENLIKDEAEDEAEDEREEDTSLECPSSLSHEGL